MTTKYLSERLDRLNAITEDCSDDMHEPDTAGVTAMVTGTKFDNAFGDTPSMVTTDGIPRPGTAEICVVLERETEFGYEFEWFNLATLIALARKAQLK